MSDKALTPIEYSQEELEELKLMGFPKPENVSHADWHAKDTVHPKHELMIHFKALGWSNRKISDELGVAASTVGNVLGQTKIKDLVKIKQKELWGQNVRSRIEALSMKATDTLEEVIDNKQEKSNLKVDVAKYIIDQGIGKAKQDIKVEGSLISEFYARLDQIGKPPRDVSDSAPHTPDPVDMLVDEIVEENFIVGQRGELGEESK